MPQSICLALPDSFLRYQLLLLVMLFPLATHLVRDTSSRLLLALTPQLPANSIYFNAKLDICLQKQGDEVELSSSVCYGAISLTRWWVSVGFP